MSDIFKLEARKKLNEIIKLSKLTKKSFCEGSKFHPSDMSAISSEKDELDCHRSISPRKLAEFVDFIDSKIKSISGRLNEVARQKINDLYREWREIALGQIVRLKSPGGYLTSEFANYISRDIDKDILNFVNTQTKGIFVVKGRRQSGVSSALMNAFYLFSKCHENKVVFIRLEDYIFNKKEYGCVRKYISSQLSSQGFEANPSKAVDALYNEIGGSKKLILIIDDLNSLRRSSANDQLEVLRWIDATHFYSIANNKNIIFLLSLSDKGNPTDLQSGIFNKSVTKHTSYFIKDEVGQLLICYDIKPDFINSFHEEFFGHPYLTHLLVDEFRQPLKITNLNFANLTKNIWAYGPFNEHMIHLMFEVRYIFQNGDLCIDGFRKLLSNQNISPLRLGALEAMGLIDFTPNGNWVISRTYRKLLA